MKTRAFLLALPLLLVTGCRDNAASVEVKGICVPDSGCSFSGTCSSFVVANPTLDSTTTDWMMLFLQVDNQLANNADAAIGRVNTNDANVDEASIEFSGALSGKRVVSVTGQVPASGSSVIGISIIPAGMGVTAAPPAWPAYAEVLANVRLRGSYKDGSRFETAEFPVTIDLTAGAPQTATCAGACPQSNQYPAACP